MDGDPRGAGRSIAFEIPLPPTVNNLYANVPGKGRVKSETYRIWKNAAAWDMRLSGGTRTRTWHPIMGRVAVTLIVGRYCRGDIDNRAKGALDLLVDMAVIGDDSQVERLTISRGGCEPKRAIVTVCEMSA